MEQQQNQARILLNKELAARNAAAAERAAYAAAAFAEELWQDQSGNRYAAVFSLVFLLNAKQLDSESECTSFLELSRGDCKRIKK
jgi:endonuclease I